MKHDGVMLNWLRLTTVLKMAIDGVSLKVMARYWFCGHQASACGCPPTSVWPMGIFERSAMGKADLGVNVEVNTSSSTNPKLYRKQSSVVTNSRWDPLLDHTTDWIVPWLTVQRSGVHLSVCHTRNTLETVVEHNRDPVGDQDSKAHGGPTRRSGTWGIETR